jgi:hypothetical protein
MKTMQLEVIPQLYVKYRRIPCAEISVKYLNLLFGYPTDKIRFFSAFTANFGVKGSFFLFILIGTRGEPESIPSLLARLFSLSREKNRIIRNQIPESSQY